MTWNDQDLPALRELESAALDVWKRHPETTDHPAARAYEVAFQHQRAGCAAATRRLRGRGVRGRALPGHGQN